MKTKSIEYKIYEDSEGKPVCALNFETNEVCIFLLWTTDMKCNPVCGYAENKSLSFYDNMPNQRVKPKVDCPLWNTASNE